MPKIADLPSAGAITGSELVPISQGGVTVQTPASTLTASGSGTVTSVALTMPTGLTVTGSPVTTSGTLAVTTSLSGLIKASGGAFSAAVSGTDYAPATTGSAILYGNGAGGFSPVTVGTGLSFAGGTLTATGSGGMTNPMTTAGDLIVGGTGGAPTRFAAPVSAGTWTLQYVQSTGTFQWSSSAASVAWGGITGTLANQTDLVASLLAAQSELVGINAQTGTAYTLVLGDAGKDVQCTNAAAVTLTVPPNSTAAFDIGTLIAFSQGGAGAVTATAGTGVTINAANGAATTAQHDARVLEKIATDTWRVW